MKRIVLHIGGDKCGSSSIQAFLSNYTINNDESTGKCFEYACLQPQGLIRGKNIRGKAISRPCGYLNSINLQKLASLSNDTLSSIRSDIATSPNSLIFSNEGWLRSSHESLTLLTDLMSQTTGDFQLEAIAFVRPPVSWINSAWWQWGAWQESLNFDEWVDKAIKSTHWSKFLTRIKQNPAISKLSVEPMRGDIVDQLCSSLTIKPSSSNKFRVNSSLPAVALKLYQEHRNLRPSPHDCRNDFIIQRAMAKSANIYNGPPWVLSTHQVERILKATKESASELLELVSPDARHNILGDERWWDASSFPSSLIADPSSLPLLDTESCFQLADDLFKLLVSIFRMPLLRFLDADLQARTSSLEAILYQSNNARNADPIFFLSMASDLLNCINEAIKVSRRYGLQEMVFSDARTGLLYSLRRMRLLASRLLK